MKTNKPRQHPKDMVPLASVADGIHATYTELARTMFNFTSPDEKKIEYYIQEADDKWVIFSKAYPLNKDGTGVAHNFVAERDSKEAAEELLDKIKRL